MSIFGLEHSVALLNQGKSRFGVPENTVEEGATADLTLFSPEGIETHQKSNILSSSKNSAFLGMDFSGTVFGIIAKNKLHLTKD